MTFDPKVVEEIHNVSMGMFSIARYYGGCDVQGVRYVYDPTRDVLVRHDVVKARAKAERAARKAAKADSAHQERRTPDPKRTDG